MVELELNSTVGNWVAQHPNTSRVFESYEIDYCCGGERSLEEACRERQLDAQLVLKELDRAAGGGQAPAEDWLHASLADLCDHIEQTHHAYLRRELPRLTEMISHADSHPELHDVQRAFAGLRAELEPHMFKEEHVLFPAIRLLERAEASPSFPFGTVANPIRMMEHEHDNAGDALTHIRQLTDGYSVPEGACNTYRVMLDGLHELETDMHQHVHKENNILFPRALKLEESLAAR
jgi:regulator of cell morphogenesis and NO signaling